MYFVKISQGQGELKGPKFQTLAAAKRYYEDSDEEYSSRIVDSKGNQVWPRIKHPKVALESTAVDIESHVDHPAHYGGDTVYEVIKVLEAWLSREQFIGFCKGNIIKYHARAGKKESENYTKCQAKAAWYDNYLKEYLERNPQ